MGLDNATIQHPLPGDLQARVENALNLVTSLEAEHARLEKMIGSQRSTINANHAEIKELEDKVKVGAETLNKLTLTLTDKADELNSLQYSIKDANHELEEATTQKVATISFVEEQKKDLATRITRVTELEAEIEKRLSDLHDKESKHQSKVEKLLEALK